MENKVVAIDSFKTICILERLVDKPWFKKCGDRGNSVVSSWTLTTWKYLETSPAILSTLLGHFQRT